MVKKITFDCDFSGVSQPVGFYIGDSVESKNPISFQAKWLAEKRGGSVPKNMIDLLEKIKKSRISRLYHLICYISTHLKK